MVPDSEPAASDFPLHRDILLAISGKLRPQTKHRGVEWQATNKIVKRSERGTCIVNSSTWRDQWLVSRRSGKTHSLTRTHFLLVAHLSYYACFCLMSTCHFPPLPYLELVSDRLSLSHSYWAKLQPTLKDGEIQHARRRRCRRWRVMSESQDNGPE